MNKYQCTLIILNWQWTRLIPELVSNSNGKITTSGSESEDEEIVNPVEGGLCTISI